MRNIRLAAAVMPCLFFVLPAAAATCPGTVVFQDAFTALNSALDAAPTPQSKITIQGGKAEFTFLKAADGRTVEYAGKPFGDAAVCVTIAGAATDKQENQTAGLVFWAANESDLYTIQIEPASGQFVVAQYIPSGGWVFPVPWTASAAIVKTPGATNAIRVLTKGTTATIFINDQEVATFTGKPPAGGGLVGFYAGSSMTSLSTWDFTNFSVSTP